MPDSKEMQVVMPQRDYTPANLDLIRRTVAADCTADEFDLFVEVARRVGLDPFMRQIHAIVYNKDKPRKRKMSIVTAIDGFRAVANRCGDYRPAMDETQFVIDPDLKDVATNPLGIERAVYTANKKDPDTGEWYAVVGTAYWEEFAPIIEIWTENEQRQWKPTGQFELQKGNWRKMPRVMIGKCAEAQALRKGWPEDLSGIYSEDEMERSLAQQSATEAAERYKEEERLKRVGGKNSIPMVWDAERGIEMVPAGLLFDRVAGFIASIEDLEDFQGFENRNAAGLQQYWAHHKADALELKRRMEARKAQLAGLEKDDAVEAQAETQLLLET